MTSIGNDKPILSICVPTFNRCNWLRNSLAFTLPQVIAENGTVELIVSDNSSTDLTSQVVEEAQKKYGPIRYHRNETNIGFLPNMQRLASELACGEYVWILGDDDFVRPGGIRTVLDVIKSYQTDYIYVNYAQFSMDNPPETPLQPEDLKEFSYYGSEDFDRRPLGRLIEIAGLDRNCFTPIYASVMKREHAKSALDACLGHELFSNLVSVVPHSLYIAENLLDKPAYYIGDPQVVITGPISWRKFLPVYLFVLFPELLSVFKRNGVSEKILNSVRSRWVDQLEDPLRQMLRNHDTPGRDRFNALNLLWEYRNVPKGRRVISKVLTDYAIHDQALYRIRVFGGRIKRSLLGARPVAGANQSDS